jgi:hypothetical protein
MFNESRVGNSEPTPPIDPKIPDSKEFSVVSKRGFLVGQSGGKEYLIDKLTNQPLSHEYDAIAIRDGMVIGKLEHGQMHHEHLLDPVTGEEIGESYDHISMNEDGTVMGTLMDFYGDDENVIITKLPPKNSRIQ